MRPLVLVYIRSVHVHRGSLSPSYSSPTFKSGTCQSLAPSVRIRSTRSLLLSCLVSILLLPTLFVSTRSFADPSPAAELARGAYMTRIAGCADCHTMDPQSPMAGGLKLPSPFGSFFTPNITFDVETGIGRWTETDFTTALRAGKRPDGKLLTQLFLIAPIRSSPTSIFMRSIST